MENVTSTDTWTGNWPPDFCRKENRHTEIGEEEAQWMKLTDEGNNTYRLLGGMETQ